MSRVILLHGNSDAARQHAERLQRAGHAVAVLAPRDAAGLQRLARKPPDAFLIDLERMPAQGRDLGIWLRQRKATRHVPIVFAGGAEEKVARARELLPDATFTSWSRVRGALRRAIARPPTDPVVRGAMAGYSGTPLPKKLGIKTGAVVALLAAPRGFEKTLGRLPEDVRLRRQLRGRPDTVLLFVRSKSELKRRFAPAARALAERGGLWIVWPKKASGVATDLAQSAVRAHGLAAGFVDYKICAVDETWSGLLFARRRAVL